MIAALQILGGLGVFLYGLRIMSAGLQKVAGNRLRAILAGLTVNRFAGVFSGFIITTAVQSSSATTVMVVSFANAGLLSLTQAIGLVMGANIGTTVTAWLVALLGFKVKISAFALPVIGIGFPLSMLGSNRAKQWSDVLIGFGLLFLGLKFLKDGVPDLKSHPEQLEFLRHLSDYGFGSVLLFIGVGTVLTIIVQSSSATMAITLALAAKGWIEYDIAAAMVLGENLGTTITATLAAIGANRNAKRVARSHTLFNVLGVLWMLPVFYLFLKGIDMMIPGDPYSDHSAVPKHLALFHTAFNVLNTFLLIWFVPQIVKIVQAVIPVQDDESNVHLEFLETGLLGTPELATVEARRGLQKMMEVVQGMLGRIQQVINNPTEKLGRLVEDIKRDEGRTDEMEEEIIDFSSQLARAGSSERVGQEVARTLEMANDVERMGDHCMNLILLAERRYEKKYEFSESAQQELREMMDAVATIVDLVTRALDPRAPNVVADAKVLESKINKLRDQARKRHAQRMQDGEVDVRAGLIYLDMMTNLEKLGDYGMNVARAAAGASPHPRLNP